MAKPSGFRVYILNHKSMLWELVPHTIYKENEGRNNSSIFFKLENISNAQKSFETNSKVGVSTT